MSAASATTIELADVRFERRAYPREHYSPGRVEEFAELYRERGPGALPPIVVVETADRSRRILVDGYHRLQAAQEAGLDELPVEIRGLLAGADPIATAYELALQASSVSSLPLSRAEKQAAIFRLISERPELSDRAIAHIVGVANSTVSRLRKRGVATQPPAEEGHAEGREGYPAPASADKLARRLVRGVCAMYKARGLGELLGVRDVDRLMGKRLARAFVAARPKDALEWAHRFHAWAEAAVAELEREEGG